MAQGGCGAGQGRGGQRHAQLPGENTGLLVQLLQLLLVLLLVMLMLVKAGEDGDDVALHLLALGVGGGGRAEQAGSTFEHLRSEHLRKKRGVREGELRGGWKGGRPARSLSFCAANT